MPEPNRPEAALSSLAQTDAEGVAGSLLLIPELHEPAAASSRKPKSRGARKPKAAALEPPVQLDLAT